MKFALVFSGVLFLVMLYVGIISQLLIPFLVDPNVPSYIGVPLSMSAIVSPILLLLGAMGVFE